MKKKKIGLFIYVIMSLLFWSMNVSAATDQDGHEVKVGDMVYFGNYEQDNNPGNGMEPIEWIVLSENGNEAILISHYCLEAMTYHDNKDKVTWENSAIRRWLNADFYNTAFDGTEQGFVFDTIVENENPESGAYGGNNTSDKVFLLSSVEAKQYFESTETRSASGTTVATANYSGNSWLLRTPASSDLYITVVFGGNVHVRSAATIKRTDKAGIRPVITVDLSGTTYSGRFGESGGRDDIPPEIREDGPRMMQWENYTVRFDEELFGTGSTQSNRQLAMISGILSAAAESESDENIRSQYAAMGITEENMITGGYGGSLAYAVGYRPIEVNGEEYYLLVVTARGSTTPYEFIMDLTTSASKNFFEYAVGKNYIAYDLVYDFEENVWNGIEVFVNAHEELDGSKLKILVTGHSLGGATANLLGARFTRYANGGGWWSASKEDIFVYTFGAIDSLYNYDDGGFLESNAYRQKLYDVPVMVGYENIHNIYNAWDTFGPNGARIFTASGNTGVSRFGHVDLFAKNVEFVMNSAITGSKNHVMPVYLDAVYNNLVDYNTRYTRIAFYAPIEVEVYQNSNLVGRIANGEIDTAATFIEAYTEEGTQFFLIPEGEEYQFEILGTDEGEMSVSIQHFGESKKEDIYIQGAKVDAGKKFQINIEDGKMDQKLLVVDENREMVAEVLADGSETTVNQVEDKVETQPDTSAFEEIASEVQEAESVSTEENIEVSEKKPELSTNVLMVWLMVDTLVILGLLVVVFANKRRNKDA